jgi:hypothetical protein
MNSRCLGFWTPGTTTGQNFGFLVDFHQLYLQEYTMAKLDSTPGLALRYLTLWPTTKRLLRVPLIPP